MGKKKKDGKSGPPYDTSRLEYKYLVIDHPLGMGSKGAKQVLKDESSRNSAASNIASWIRAMLMNSSLTIDQVFMQGGTYSHVIVTLPKATKVERALGRHQWNKFLPALLSAKHSDDKASLVFEYNYRQQGDPENHNWDYGLPDDRVLTTVTPYPRPSLDVKVPNSLVQHVIPLPKNLSETIKKDEELYVKPVLRPEDHEPKPPAPAAMLEPGPLARAFKPNHDLQAISKMDSRASSRVRLGPFLRADTPKHSPSPFPAPPIIPPGASSSQATAGPGIMPSNETSNISNPQPSNSAHVFQPYVSPAHHPAHSLLTTFVGHGSITNAVSSTLTRIERAAATPSASRIPKMDPDDEDEAEQQARLLLEQDRPLPTPVPGYRVLPTSTQSPLKSEPLNVVIYAEASLGFYIEAQQEGHLPQESGTETKNNLSVKHEAEDADDELAALFEEHQREQLSTTATTIVSTSADKDEDEDPDDELAALFEEHLREQAEANSAAFEEPVSNLGSSLKIEDHPSTSRIPETPAPHPVHVKPEPMELDRLLFKDPIPAESYGPFHDSGDSTIVKHEDEDDPNDELAALFLEHQRAGMASEDRADASPLSHPTTDLVHIKPEPLDGSMPWSHTDPSPATLASIDVKVKIEDTKPFSYPLGAHVNIGGQAYLLCTLRPDIQHIPQPPQPKDLAIRRDYLLGAEDPMQWPQMFNSNPEYAYLCAIPTRPQAPPFDLWSELQPDGYVIPDTSQESYIVPELGRRAQRFADTIEHDYLIDGTRPPILSQLLRTQRAGLAAVQRPTPFNRLRLMWRHLQRTWLQIMAYVDYNSDGPLIGPRIGTITEDMNTAIRLAERGIPVWVRIPSNLAQNVPVELLLREPTKPESMGVLTGASGAPPIQIMGDDTAAIVEAIRCVTNALFRIDVSLGEVSAPRSQATSPSLKGNKRAHETSDDTASSLALKRVKTEPID